jgi:toxin CcdB
MQSKKNMLLLAKGFALMDLKPMKTPLAGGQIGQGIIESKLRHIIRMLRKTAFGLTGYARFRRPIPFLGCTGTHESQQRIGIIGFIVFQSDYASAIETVLVIPCREIAANLDMGTLTPRLLINGMPVLAMVPQVAGIDRRALGRVVVGSAASIRDELVRALDRLVTGF